MASEIVEKPRPCSKRQYLYTASQADVTLFGGAAGSGKSEIAVIDFCPYMRLQNFIGIISRRTTPMLKGAGGILTKCKRTFAREFAGDTNYKCEWKEKDNRFVTYKKEKLTDGKIRWHEVSSIYLKHSEYEANIVENWQGVEANIICLDEATQYTYPMLNYISSRMRNPSCPEVSPKLKMTCNPDADHFLRKWVEPYLFEDGTPDRSKDGLIRYFQMDDGEVFFADTPEAVVEKTGCLLDDVMTFTFISANVTDNPIIQEVQPKYVAWLRGLKGVDKARLCDGNWYIREAGASYFNREWCPIISVPYKPSDFTKLVRAYDWAETLPHDGNRNPDYTACVLMGKLKNGNYVILEVIRHRMRSSGWMEFILDNAKRDGKKTLILLPQDPNPLAGDNAKRMAKAVIEAGYQAKLKRSTQGKLEGFVNFAAVAELGFIEVMADCATDLWNKIYDNNEFFFKELEVFDGKRKNTKVGHDDQNLTSRQ